MGLTKKWETHERNAYKPQKVFALEGHLNNSLTTSSVVSTGSANFQYRDHTLRSCMGDIESLPPDKPIRLSSPETQAVKRAATQDSASVSPSFENNEPIPLQPETRPILQHRLVAEVKGSYAGLFMVVTKCIEIDNVQSPYTNANQLGNAQCQALMALHPRLTHQHHGFFFTDQHPLVNAELSSMVSKYAMPARMWRHGIHSFFELLRYKLPVSLEYMLTFICLAYKRMAHLYEIAPAFHSTWMECFEYLGRYRQAIEDNNIQSREVLTAVRLNCYWNLISMMEIQCDPFQSPGFHVVPSLSTTKKELNLFVTCIMCTKSETGVVFVFTNDAPCLKILEGSSKKYTGQIHDVIGRLTEEFWNKESVSTWSSCQVVLTQTRNPICIHTTLKPGDKYWSQIIYRAVFLQSGPKEDTMDARNTRLATPIQQPAAQIENDLIAIDYQSSFRGEPKIRQCQGALRWSKATERKYHDSRKTRDRYLTCQAPSFLYSIFLASQNRVLQMLMEKIRALESVARLFSSLSLGDWYKVRVLSS